MKNETYIDLENQFKIEKNNSIKIEIIKDLINKYPNDQDLGREIRKHYKR